MIPSRSSIGYRTSCLGVLPARSVPKDHHLVLPRRLLVPGGHCCANSWIIDLNSRAWLLAPVFLCRSFDPERDWEKAAKCR